MNPNDETIYNGTVAENEVNPQVENNKKKESWKLVGLGAATGILIGAGALYAGTAMANNSEAAPEDSDGEAGADTAVGDMQVAHVTPGQSFAEAFAEAREEVGPGGVFHWNGGIYNTYTKEEWDSMNAEEKDDFASHVHPEYTVDQIDTDHITAETPQVNVHIDEVHVHEHVVADDDVHIVGPQEIPDDNPGYTTEEIEFDGHQGVIIHPDDTDAHDIAIVDLNDNEEIDDGEIVDLETGDIYNTDGSVMAQIDMAEDDTNEDVAVEEFMDDNPDMYDQTSFDDSCEENYGVDDIDSGLI